VELAKDRLDLWHHLREMAGLEVSESTRQSIAGEMEEEIGKQVDALKAEHERTVTDLRTTYPRRSRGGWRRA